MELKLSSTASASDGATPGYHTRTCRNRSGAPGCDGVAGTDLVASVTANAVIPTGKEVASGAIVGAGFAEPLEEHPEATTSIAATAVRPIAVVTNRPNSAIRGQRSRMSRHYGENVPVTSAGIGYLAALFLAATFLIAAISKLRDVSATADEFELLGVPAPKAMARFVPVIELAIAAGLVIVPAVGGLFALVTLAFFTTFLVGRLRAGVRVPCACFGAAGTASLSGVEIVRNLGLVVLAAAAMLVQEPTIPSVADFVLTGAVLGACALSLRWARSR
ncbi:Methylamine utilisation protein, MauE [Acidimicrobiia bacterium]